MLEELGRVLRYWNELQGGIFSHEYGVKVSMRLYRDQAKWMLQVESGCNVAVVRVVARSSPSRIPPPRRVSL